jgi:hypothetical protein
MYYCISHVCKNIHGISTGFLGLHDDPIVDENSINSMNIATTSVKMEQDPPIFIGIFTGPKDDKRIYVFNSDDKFYAANAHRVKTGSVRLRCRKHARDKCKFSVILKTVDIHGPTEPGFYNTNNFTVLPSKHAHTCFGYDDVVSAIRITPA